MYTLEIVDLEVDSEPYATGVSFTFDSMTELNTTLRDLIDKESRPCIYKIWKGIEE